MLYEPPFTGANRTYLLLEHFEGHAVAHQKVLLTRGLFSPYPVRLAVPSRGRNYLALCFRFNQVVCAK